jgi:hypothetical protein
MARGNCIIITPEPKGRFEEITVVGTPKPGTCMTTIAGTSTYTNGGRTSMEPAGASAGQMGADGDRISVAVLLCATDPGATGVPPFIGPTDAYTTGSRGCVYYPQPGDELNMILMDLSGTGSNQDFVVGTKLIIDDGTGKLLMTTGTPESEPFECQELKSDLAADYLCHVKYCG